MPLLDDLSNFWLRNCGSFEVLRLERLVYLISWYVFEADFIRDRLLTFGALLSTLHSFGNEPIDLSFRENIIRRPSQKWRIHTLRSMDANRDATLPCSLQNLIVELLAN